MIAISTFLGNLPYLHVHGTEPQESTLLPLDPEHLMLSCFALGKGCRSAWDQQGAAWLLQT